MALFEPLDSWLDIETGRLEPGDKLVTRKLSDLVGAFVDEEERLACESAENAVVYEMFERHSGGEPGHQLHAVTVIRPGRVGREYFATLGGFRGKEESSETIILLRGHGWVTFQSGPEARAVEAKKGSIVYAPPGWGRKVANTGREVMVFLSVRDSDCGFEESNEPFGLVLLDEEGEAVVRHNPAQAGAVVG